MRTSNFIIGQRVKMTKSGTEQGLGVRGRIGNCTGTVIGLCPPLAIKVLRDGTKTPVIYHADFWRPIP